MEIKRGHYARELTEEEVKKLDRDDQLSVFQQNKFEKEAKKHWDLFYKRNSTHFFKDRHWITREFPDLLQALSEIDLCRPVLLEVGCGVGNTVFPLLQENTALFIHACDFSPRAIELVKVHSLNQPASSLIRSILEERLLFYAGILLARTRVITQIGWAWGD